MSGGLGARVRGVAAAGGRGRRGASRAGAHGAADWFLSARRALAAGFSDPAPDPQAGLGERVGDRCPRGGEEGDPGAPEARRGERVGWRTGAPRRGGGGDRCPRGGARGEGGRQVPLGGEWGGQVPLGGE